MCNRIKIGLVFETMEEAKDFIETYAPTAMRKIYSKYELVYETPINVYTADGKLLATYEGKIDIDTNDGGYVKFDFNGKRYIYYNCFIETIAEL